MLIVDQYRSVTLTKTPAPLGHSFGLDKYLIFYKKSGAPESQWQYTIASDNGKTVALQSPSVQVGDKVCVKYFISVPQARSTLIGANFLPQELTLILTTKLISSSTDRVEDGEPDGEIVLRIPRFKLDANFNLQMAMSSFSSVPISGTALACQDDNDPFSLHYGEIVEYTKNTSIQTGLQETYVDVESNQIFGVYQDGHASLLPITTVIPNDIFNGCISLLRAELSDQITEISNEAFVGCTALSTVILYANTPPTLADSDAFPDECIIYVPSDSIESYQNTSPWSSLPIYAIPSLKLFTPSISLSGNILSISSANYPVNYYVYANGQQYGEAVPKAQGTTITTVDLSGLSSVAADNYIYVVAQNTGYISSDRSNQVTYSVYSITGDGTITYGSLSGDTTIVKDETASVVLNPSQFYDLPMTIGVSNASFTYLSSSGDISLSEATGNVIITAVCVPQTFSIVSSIANGSISGSDSIVAYTSATLTIAASSTAYNLPSTVTVVNATLNSYDSSSGTLSISNPTGQVSITAVCDIKTFTISASITNGGLSGPDSIQALSETIVTIVPNTGYYFPNSATASNATVAYTASTGEVVLSDPAGAVTVFASCPGSFDFAPVGVDTVSIGAGNWNEPDLIIPAVSPDNKTVVSIAEHGFENYDSLKTVSFAANSSVTHIGQRAFYSCGSLTAVTYAESVESVGPYTFSSCTALTAVYITNLTSWCNIDFADVYGNALFEAENLYLNNVLITNLVIPDEIESIKQYAFVSGVHIVSVVVPDSVTSIGKYAFHGCTSLASITYTGTKAQWNAISKGNGWNGDTGSYTIHCTDGDIPKS